MKKILIMILVLTFAVTGCGSGENQETEQGAEQDTKTDETTEVASDKKEEKKEYGLDEWWEVEGLWKLKIDSVSFTDERNDFSNIEDPEAVVIIKYTYENLGYEDDVTDLYLIPDNVIDGEGKVSVEYPTGTTVNAKETPVGATTEGAEESYAITSKEGDLKVYFSKFDNDLNDYKATFVIPLPSE